MKIILLIAFTINLFTSNQLLAGKYKVESFPKFVSKVCRNGIANIYDECSDQNTILGDAMKQATESNKSVLLVYGAEWCIWCHVFDKYINGASRKFQYHWEYEEGETSVWEMVEKQNANAEKEAEELNKYVSENFVIAHIEGYHSPNGMEVIANTGFDSSLIQVLPYILVLNSKAEYAGHMLPYNAIEKLEIREDSGEEYRGFDRKVLLSELTKLRNISKQSEK
jgi:hypothetical protein